jgi:hypothetical protein
LTVLELETVSPSFGIYRRYKYHYCIPQNDGEVWC